MEPSAEKIWKLQAVAARDVVAFVRASRELGDFFADVIRYRRNNPGDDLISSVLAQGEPGTMYSDRELASTYSFLFTAGHESTSKLIGSMLHALITSPEQTELLLRGEVPISAAVREVARLEAPIQVTLRVATSPTQVGHTSINSGDLIAVLLGAANRDPARYQDPDTLNFMRPAGSRPDLTFGRAVHYCIGSSLAVTETEIATELILERSQYLLTPTVMKVEMCPNMTLHGPEVLRLSFS